MFLRKGDLVQFESSTPSQIAWGNNDDPELVLQKNQVYEVEKVQLRSYHTKIHLKGIEGKFNGDSFRLVKSSELPIPKIAYLHGLESTNKGAKTDWLKFIANIYAPKIDYTQSEIYQTLKAKIIAFKPDLIIGSSMGGYFAFEIAKELNYPALLFNPALHSRSFEPDMSGHQIGQHNPRMQVVLGENDKVINPEKTLEILRNRDLMNIDFTFLDIEHRIPYRVFRDEVEEVLNKKIYR
ncbi:MAG: hypothetical protein H6584_06200 [Flavobacteriales bacterium]|nr:hypothetical protein [Flavobacteriales bacterium]MCB9426603.1 hypothetical protein [Flavobacteriales bacterium]